MPRRSRPKRKQSLDPDFERKSEALMHAAERAYDDYSSIQNRSRFFDSSARNLALALDYARAKRKAAKVWLRFAREAVAIWDRSMIGHDFSTEDAEEAVAYWDNIVRRRKRF